MTLRASPGVIVAAMLVMFPAIILACLGASSSDTLQFAFRSIDVDRSIRTVPAHYLPLLRGSLLGLALANGLGAYLLYRQRTNLAMRLAPLRLGFRSLARQIQTDWELWRHANWKLEASTVGLLLCAGILFRWREMQLPLSVDEAITFVFFSSRSWIDILSDYSIPNNHILNTSLMAVSQFLFGSGPLALRLPAFLAGVLSIPLLYWFVRREFDGKAALLAVALAASAQPMVEFSSVARGYSFILLFFLISLLSLSYWKEVPSIGAQTVFVLAFALSLYASPPALLAQGTAVLWLLLSSPRAQLKSTVWFLICSGLAVATFVIVLYSPAILRVGLHSLVANPYAQSMSVGAFLQDTRVRSIQTLSCWMHAPPFVRMLFVAGLAVSIVKFRTLRECKLLLPSALLFLGLFLIVERVTLQIRFLTYIFLILIIYSALGLSKLFAPKRPEQTERPLPTFCCCGFACVLALAWGVIPSDPLNRPCVLYPPREYETAARFLLPQIREGDVLVCPRFSGAVESFQYYFLRENRTPALVYGYEAKRASTQLQDFDRIFLAVVKEPYRLGKEIPAYWQSLNMTEERFNNEFSGVSELLRLEDVVIYELHLPDQLRSSKHPPKARRKIPYPA